MTSKGAEEFRIFDENVTQWKRSNDTTKGSVTSRFRFSLQFELMIKNDVWIQQKPNEKAPCHHFQLDPFQGKASEFGQNFASSSLRLQVENNKAERNSHSFAQKMTLQKRTTAASNYFSLE